jgi:hypothetical protein
MFRVVEREPIRKSGDAQRWIEFPEMVHRSLRFIRSARKRMARCDDTDY